MSQVTSRPTTVSGVPRGTASRRAILLAGIAAAPAVAVPALAIAAEPDPIFAAIERHKVAFLSLQEATRVRFHMVDLKGHPEYDAVKLASAKEAKRMADDADNDAANALATVRPTTIAGVLALIRHVEAFNDGAFFLEPWPGDPVSDWQSLPMHWPFHQDEDEVDLFGFLLLANVRRALEAMAGVS